METNPHDLKNLFAQLGLANQEKDVDDFIRLHRLDAGLSIFEAPFWNASQAEFLQQSLADDSDWCEAIDELSTRLSSVV